MKYSLLSILLLFVTSLHATHYSYTNGVVENGDFNVDREVKQGSNYIEVTYRFGGFTVEKTTIGDQEFHSIRINGAPVVGEKGNPELPLISDLLSVGSMKLDVQIINHTAKEYKTFNVLPSSGEIIQSSNDSIKELVFSDVYKKDAYFPENNASVASIQSYRSYPFATINLCPIQYNPIRKTIKCCSEITYRISWNKKDYVSESAMAGDDAIPLNYKKMPSLLRGVVADYVPSNDTTESASLRAGDASLTKEYADYLIVTTDNFLPAVEKFKTWKSKLGYKCEVLSSSKWSTANDVDQAIKTAYMANEKPEYLLIVGDITDVPSFLTEYEDEDDQKEYGSWASDLKYVCMDGGSDYTADMARGRISVKNLDEANTVFEKIIKYEQSPVLDDDFYNTGLHCAFFQDRYFYYIENGYLYLVPPDGVEDRRFVLTSEEVRNYIKGWGKNINRVYVKDGYNIQPQYYSTIYSNGAKLPAELLNSEIWTGKTADVTDYINKGACYVLHRDHGDVNAWGDPWFEIDNAKALTNGDKTPVVFSLNCLTGSFQKDCLCEAFLRNANGGAVGVFGATALSYSGPNDAFAVGMFDAMFPNPGITTVWANNNSYKPTDLEPIYNMGHVMNKGLLMMPHIYTTSSANIKYTNQIFHWFGDPSMELRTEIPACLDATVTKTGTTVKVTTPVKGCRISLCSVDDAGDTYVQSYDGVSEATFDGIDFNYAVTVYKHNYVPFVYDPNTSSSVSDAVTYIQNKTYTEDEDVKASAIEAGRAVTTQKEEGDVVVKNVNVNYLAAKSIKLAAGFSASISDAENKFVAKIDDIDISTCPYSPEEPTSKYNAVEVEATEYYQSNASGEVTIEDVNLTNVNSLAANDIKAYVQDNEIIVVLGDLNANVVISDMSGKTIASKSGNGSLRFNVNKEAYVVTVLNTNSSKSEKVIVE